MGRAEEFKHFSHCTASSGDAVTGSVLKPVVWDSVCA